jgi:hypothetical protein
MVGFALAKSLRGDLVCQFEKQVWKVREGRRRPLLAQESTQRISNHVLTPDFYIRTRNISTLTRKASTKTSQFCCTGTHACPTFAFT